MAFVDITSELGSPSFGHAWRAKDGGASTIHATVRLGGSAITFDTPAEALEVATAALAAYQALTRLEADPELATVNPAEVDVTAIRQDVDSSSWECSACGGRCIGARPLTGLCRGCAGADELEHVLRQQDGTI